MADEMGRLTTEEICRHFGQHVPEIAGPNCRSAVSYREAGRYLGTYLGLDAGLGQDAATDLVAEGHLPRSFGRSIVRPTWLGLAMLAIVILARGAGLSRGAAALLATQGERDGFDRYTPTVHSSCVHLAVGNGRLSITLPAGLWEELCRLERVEPVQ